MQTEQTNEVSKVEEQKQLLIKAADFIKSMPTYGEFEDDVALVLQIEACVKS